VLNRGGGDTTLNAELPGNLVVNAPVQNTGGNGSILLLSGGDLVIRDSLPEPPDRMENPANPEQFFEILVSGDGAVRGEARGAVRLDDGETDYVIVRTATGQITNVLPLMKVTIINQGGSSINEKGQGFIQVTLGDDLHLETNYHVQIVWGDGEIENFPIPGTIHPQREPGSTDPRFISGALVMAEGAMGEAGMGEAGQPGVYTFMHRYFQHPNLQNPAAPIPIRVELRHDARQAGIIANDAIRPADGSPVFNGIRFVDQITNEIFAVAESAFTVPGTGNFTFIKIVESVIIPVEVRTVLADPAIQTAVSFTTTTGVRGEFRVAAAELQRQEEYRFFLIVVDDILDAESEERIDLSLEMLSDPLSLFRTRRFPNGHYREYLEEIRTRRVRLILDVHIFNGKVVPPNYREGAGEKQPGADESQVANPPPAALPAANESSARPAANDAPVVAVKRERWPEATSAALADEPRSMSSVARLWRKLNQH
jgi:hypothetical protein